MGKSQRRKRRTAEKAPSPAKVALLGEGSLEPEYTNGQNAVLLPDGMILVMNRTAPAFGKDGEIAGEHVERQILASYFMVPERFFALARMAAKMTAQWHASYGDGIPEGFAQAFVDAVEEGRTVGARARNVIRSGE